MSDSDSDEIPYSERAEWKDIEPIPQDEGPSPVVVIGYTAEFKDAMGYFRAILHRDEKSRRALELTKDVILLNPANYTAWFYYRACVESLAASEGKSAGALVQSESEYFDDICLSQPKNYQVWHHREWTVTHLKAANLVRLEDELKIAQQMIDDDKKNYHVWAFRQWLLRTFNSFGGELDYCTQLIDEDIRNNSVWNQRFFVIDNTSGWTDQVRANEIEYAASYVSKAPNNQSPWNYLCGCVLNCKYSDWPRVEAFAREIIAKAPFCVHAHSLLLEIEIEHNTVESLASALKRCEELEKLDSVRRKYWAMRRVSIAGRSTQA